MKIGTFCVMVFIMAFLWVPARSIDLGLLNKGSAFQYLDANRELTQLMKSLMLSKKSGEEHNLIRAQAAWIDYREAQSRYEASQVSGEFDWYRTYYMSMTDLTFKRIKELSAEREEVAKERVESLQRYIQESHITLP